MENWYQKIRRVCVEARPTAFEQPFINRKFYIIYIIRIIHIDNMKYQNKNVHCIQLPQGSFFFFVFLLGISAEHWLYNVIDFGILWVNIYFLLLKFNFIQCTRAKGCRKHANTVLIAWNIHLMKNWMKKKWKIDQVLNKYILTKPQF